LLGELATVKYAISPVGPAIRMEFPPGCDHDR
jgi:hypothetical protein